MFLSDMAATAGAFAGGMLIDRRNCDGAVSETAGI